MLKKERQDHILEILKSRKYCTVDYLSRQLYVAPITIRRDLSEMESEGLLTRCFGGATVPEYENREIPFEIRNRTNFLVKEELGKRAAKFIRTGDVVFLDASSTVSHIADHLSAEQDLTVITNSMLVAEKLRDKHIRCYLTGGMPVDYSYALVGPIAEQTVAGLHANICFFSAQGVDQNGTVSDQSELESSLRRWMIRNSEKQYFLFDSSKYPKRFAFQICAVEEISGVITDRSDLAFPVKS